MHIWSRKIDESSGFGVFFLIFLFSQFSMVLSWSDSQFRLWLDFLPGAASKSIYAWISYVFRFSVHMVFMRRPCAKLLSSAFVLPTMGPPCMDSIFHIELIPEFDNLFCRSYFEHCSHQPAHVHIFAYIRDPGDETRLVEKSSWMPAYYSYRADISEYICSTSHSSLSRGSRI